MIAIGKGDEIQTKSGKFSFKVIDLCKLNIQNLTTSKS